MPGTFARVALTLGMIAASVAYGGWIMQRTALDPEPTGDVAESLIETRPVQEMLTDELRSQVLEATTAAGLGTEVNSDPRLQGAMDEVLEDPRFVEAFGDAVTAVHRQLLDGTEGGDDSGAGRRSVESTSSSGATLDTTAVTAAARDVVARIDPQVAAHLVGSEVRINLGDADLPDLHTARDAARVITVGATVIALFLLALAVGMHASPRRGVGAVGRRLALLAVGPLIGFVVVPWMLERSDNDTPTVVASALGAYRERVLPSALVLAAAGLAVWLGSRSWPSVEPADPYHPASLEFGERTDPRMMETSRPG